MEELMIISRRLAIIGWLIVSAMAGTTAMAQTEPEANNGNLYLQPRTGTRAVVVPAGSKVSVRYRQNPLTYRGVKAHAINDSAAVFGSDTVGIKYVEELVVRRESLHRAGKKVFWFSVISVVALWLIFGITLLLATAPGVFTVIFAILLVLAAIPASVAMPTGLIVGIVLLLTANKHYHIYRDWTLSAKPPQKPEPNK